MARSNPNQLKVKAFRRGQLAEYLAALYLLFKGYRILAVRYKTYLGEVDLIVKKQDLIIFVEVKARKSARLAIDAVGTNSQKRIEAAARIWLSKQKNAAAYAYRFDIIAVTGWFKIQHYENAF